MDWYSGILFFLSGYLVSEFFVKKHCKKEFNRKLEAMQKQYKDTLLSFGCKASFGTDGELIVVDDVIEEFVENEN